MMVKMQRPLYSDHPDGPMVLIYNRSRSFQVQVPLDEEYEEMFEEHGLPEWGRLKMFAEVTITRDGEIEVNAFSDGDLGW